MPENFSVTIFTFLQAIFYAIELNLIFLPCDALKNRVSGGDMVSQLLKLTLQQMNVLRSSWGSMNVQGLTKFFAEDL